MTGDFLTASTHGRKALQAAQARHARLRAQADERLAAALARHASEVAAAAGIEAAAWRELMNVPGMTIATASRIGGTSASSVRRWLATAGPRGASCS